MTRRKLKLNQKLKVDPVFHSVIVFMLINRISKKGKKQLAFRILCHTLNLIENKTSSKLNSLEILEQAIRNLSPSVKIQTKRIGGAVYTVPVEIHSFRATNLAIHLLLTAAKNRRGHTFTHKLAGEIMDASQNIGNSIRQKEELHRIASSSSKLIKQSKFI